MHSEGQYIDKAVKSVRSTVTNIRDYHDLGETPQFLTKFIQTLNQTLGAPNFINADESAQIMSLKNEKFILDSWILGYSPKYQHNRRIRLDDQEFELDMKVEKGLIIEIDLKSDSNESFYTNELSGCINSEISIETLKIAFKDHPNITLLQLLQFF